MNGAQDRAPRGPTHWRRWFLLFWAGAAVYMLHYKWGAIHWFALSDTDDNMRFAQVRAWLAGQGWYDLRQHRIDPPGGISIHWSRIVDLPIAGLLVLLRPLLGGQEAARWACAIAPMLAFGASLYGMMLAVRRLVDRWAFFLAFGIMCCAQASMLMWMPLRIDHHGWQLATLIWAVTGIADARRVRGGLTTGIATAISLAIGLELLPYLATIGALTLLWWVIDAGERDRLRAYGASLAGGAALGYALFGSFDNAQPLCDALTPVYLSTLLEAGAALVAIGSFRMEARALRIAVAVATVSAIGGAFALTQPQCLGRPEHISPELERLWFSHIKEAKPLYAHGWRIWFPTIALSAVGLVGAVVTWRRAGGTAREMPWLVVALLSLFSTALLLWQTRAGPASQAMGVIGATALGQPLVIWTLGHRAMLVRVLGTVAAFVLVSGAFAGLIVRYIPEHRSAYRKTVDQANRRCPTLPALKPIAALPATTILTFVDLGPRLISVTHHSAIAGPYHRGGAEILDVQHSFRAADPEVAHAVMRRHGATLLLLCPGLSESTVYQSENPGGFYTQLRDGKVPGWLAPMPLPAYSPFKLWKLVG
ncbi:AcrB/AcrD/AcrF family protein [Sphingomonas bacterium]|uniref:AcrB/AcrD/AcrF family protein n=1 Tax=Sphingomonas bacterium TaxID=1895847 RepID=UPI001576733E|nr:AcrB/AcrD/AcrF family protein [Sphingomonas bacterium]